jgi:hypothetical protein
MPYWLYTLSVSANDVVLEEISLYCSVYCSNHVGFQYCLKCVCNLYCDNCDTIRALEKRIVNFNVRNARKWKWAIFPLTAAGSTVQSYIWNRLNQLRNYYINIYTSIILAAPPNFLPTFQLLLLQNSFIPFDMKLRKQTHVPNTLKDSWDTDLAIMRSFPSRCGDKAVLQMNGFRFDVFWPFKVLGSQMYLDTSIKKLSFPDNSKYLPIQT